MLGVVVVGVVVAVVGAVVVIVMVVVVGVVVVVGLVLVVELFWFGVVDTRSPAEVGGAGVACGEVFGGATC